ncbi:FAD-dependent oxidoreductase [Halalkalibacterium ligniniphilum]|uniref:FAD-dependent oxidoreductase n=1 Tax=Halalkalibacterium ligniniphilum TaxID=1134413 RepID=UPI0003495D3E|nr:FAD-dependent oxidoreductase [Halalkalibacterium ligniniphilum]
MNYVIIGGDAAGMSAAIQIVRGDEDAKIITLEKGAIYSYAQCGLPYVVGGVILKMESLIARDVETFRRKYGIDARINHEVTAVDLEKKQVRGKEFEISYDKLLIATGASPVVPDWDGLSLDGIHTIKTIPDTQALLDDLTDETKNIVIVGGGYVGLEMAENFVELGKQVTIIQRGSQLANIFDEDMAELIHDEAKKHGVSLLFGEAVQGFEGTSRVKGVKTDNQTIPADLVVLAIGVKPNTDFLQGLGFHFHSNGALLVNPYMETNIPNVYAAGDCATQYHRIKQRDDYVPLGTHANKQGRIAGMNMVGKPRTFKGIVGTSILKFFDLTLGRTGLSAREAESLGFPYATTKREVKHIAGYYPGTKPLTIKLIYHKEKNTLLGAQVIGEDGVDKRTDVLATALFQEMTLEELEDLDLSYAPPYNGVWDPIQQTLRRRRS